ncbi:MAG: hypothetical protein WDM90_09380 [Ferruginibacter sp.]
MPFVPSADLRESISIQSAFSVLLNTEVTPSPSILTPTFKAH